LYDIFDNTTSSLGVAVHGREYGNFWEFPGSIPMGRYLGILGISMGKLPFYFPKSQNSQEYPGNVE